MFPIKTLVVPTDFSEPCEAALEYAVNLAKHLHTKIFLLHSLDQPLIESPQGDMISFAGMAERAMLSARKQLDDTVARLSSDAIEISSLLGQGEPRQVILAAANEVGADLIVMGTHGRRGLMHTLLGSVAEGVVRTSPVPVLTVRPKPKSA